MWPALVVGLLLFNITASMTILFFAKSDGGPEIIPDYYEQSVNFNDQMLAEQASAQTGWSVELALAGEVGELTVTDRQGQALEELKGRITFYRPQRAQELGESELQPSPDSPGQYRFENLTHRIDEAGLWDLAIELHDGELRYIDRIRRSVH